MKCGEEEKEMRRFGDEGDKEGGGEEMKAAVK